MLLAASDIIAKQEWSVQETSLRLNSTQHCEENIVVKNCQQLSTGAVLLADILPALLIKLTFPFFMHRIPFGLRHFVVCSLQVVSYLVVAFSNSIYVSLLGVATASLGSGLGEICYLGLSAHYSKNTISAWSSGTGGAGIVAAMAYAVFTEPKLAGLSPRTALLSMLIVPVVFAITYWFVLTRSPTVHTMKLLEVNTWLVPKPSRQMQHFVKKASISNDISKEAYLPNEKRIITESESLTFFTKLRIVAPLLRYMIPLSLVYYAEYLINQGIVETIYFDCSHGFSLSKASQYRWYQVLYQVGVFISRSSVNLIELPSWALYVMPVLQMVNAVIFFLDSIYKYIPHIALMVCVMENQFLPKNWRFVILVWLFGESLQLFATIVAETLDFEVIPKKTRTPFSSFSLILMEGLVGGASYVNTFNLVHKEALPHVKEFSLSITSLSDSLGIVFAALSSISVHTYICSVPTSNSRL